jgi:hypothetical protein
MRMTGRFCAALSLCVVAIASVGVHTGEASDSRGVVEATRQAALTYFDQLQKGNGWQASFAEGMRFTIRTSVPKEIEGRETYLRAAAPFYSMIRSVKVRELIIDGERACALTHYELRPPNGGAAFSSDVAEILTIRDDEIVALEIYFDTAPYPK